MVNYEDICFAVGPYFNKLAAFRHAEDIREFLVSEGIQALKRDPYSCAIAQYVEKSGCKVSVDGTHVLTRATNECVTARIIREATPAMKTFIANFDSGLYPELVAECHS